MVRIPNHPLTTLPMLVTDHPLATLIISRVVRGWSEGGQHLRNGVTMVVRGWSACCCYAQ